MDAPSAAANLLTVALLRRRRAGARTFVETQLWAIWTTFVAAVSVCAFVNYFMGLDTFFLGPVIAVLAAVAFASMGSLMGRHWFGVGALFLVAALAMRPRAGRPVPHPRRRLGRDDGRLGWILHRARRRRRAEPAADG